MGRQEQDPRGPGPVRRVGEALIMWAVFLSTVVYLGSLVPHPGPAGEAQPVPVRVVRGKQKAQGEARGHRRREARKPAPERAARQKRAGRPSRTGRNGTAGRGNADVSYALEGAGWNDIDLPALQAVARRNGWGLFIDRRLVVPGQGALATQYSIPLPASMVGRSRVHLVPPLATVQEVLRAGHRVQVHFEGGRLWLTAMPDDGAGR